MALAVDPLRNIGTFKTKRALDVKRSLTLTAAAVFCLLAHLASVFAAEGWIALGTDDRTGDEIGMRTGKPRPFVAWTKEEVAAFKEKIKGYKGGYPRGGPESLWGHPKGGMLVRAGKGDPVACGQVWQVAGDTNAAKTAAAYLLEKARTFDADAFLKLGCWGAPTDLEKSSLIYDLLAGGSILSPEEDVEVRGYLRAAYDTLKRLWSYNAIHNIGTHLEQGAWTAALCLEDGDMLRERLAQFKENVGKGLLPGGYWYEGTGYASMVQHNLLTILERAQRSGLKLAFLHCRRKPLSDEWADTPGYMQAGTFFEWYYHMPTPFWELPNIGDGEGPCGFRSDGALRVRDLVPNRDFLDRWSILGLRVNKIDPHKWAALPPWPDVEPLDCVDDVAWPETGIFVFRTGTGLDTTDLYALLLALPRTGYHTHNDGGHIDIARYGRWLTGDIESSVDPPNFSGGYTTLREEFSCQRWAHNTVVVGGEGWKKHVDFPRVHYASALDPKAKTKVADVTIPDFNTRLRTSQRRRVLVTDEYVVVTDDVTAAPTNAASEVVETTFDWFFHGVTNAPWSIEKPPGGKTDFFPAYVPQHSKPDHDLVWHEAYQTGNPWRGTFMVDTNSQIGLRVWQLDVKGGAYCAGDFTPPRHAIPGIYTGGERIWMICQRKSGAEAHFTAVLEPFKGQPSIGSVRLCRNRPNDRLIVVNFGDGRQDTVTIGDGDYGVERKR